ncbi:MAG: UxaA family hydrolase, partial [Planctomycetes bacterium]|nr:UxaA family hydrolase [Planctomycetota bacterium]
HVHVHNCCAGAFDRDLAFATEASDPPAASVPRTFLGYRRPGGRAGTRNYIAVISTVNCSATVARAIAGRFDSDALAAYPRVDGVVAFTHKGGCGMRYDGPDHDRLNRVLAGIARHPNVGGYLIVGLGCEIAQIPHLAESENLVRIDGIIEGRPPADAPPMMTIQASGGSRRTIEAAAEAIERMLPAVNEARREELPASMLVVGLQCGGSDGQSGITANPAVGAASDLLVAQGATVVLGETPEIYGAEHLLVRRAASREVGEALLRRIRWWEQHTRRLGAEIDNNPTPGNKAGGITTIYEKSLGAIAKAGSTRLEAVYDYAQPITRSGFVIMDTPGYDPVSLTGIMAGGANVCLFTTGRGSVYGGKPAPTIKISSTTQLRDRMPEDIDIDAGVILGGESVETVGERIFEMLLEVASGRRPRSEELGAGEEEFAPWITGPTL